MNELDEKSLELDNLTEADKNLMIEIFRRWAKNSIKGVTRCNAPFQQRAILFGWLSFNNFKRAKDE